MTDLEIVNARAITRPGTVVDPATITIREGRIAGVEQREAGSTDALDAAGRWVTAGLVDCHVHIGINEEAEGPAGLDNNETSRPNTAGLRAIDATNILDVGFEDAVEAGVTTVIVKPGSGNPIGGITLPMKTWGASTVDELWLGRDVSLKSAVGENPKTAHEGALPVTRMGIAAVIRQAFEDARHYVALRDQAAADSTPFAVDLDLEALGRVLSGELLWDVHAHRHDDIVTALRIADEFGLRIVVNHGTEGDRIAQLLAARDIPVVFGPMGARTKVELEHYSARTVSVLAEAGVRVALITDHPEQPIGALQIEAVLAVRAGLSPDVALAALTSTPAEIYGLDDRVGSLAPGLDGDVVIWSGHPLDASSTPDTVIIGGRVAFERPRP